MDADEEDFVFYGTPIEREEEMTSRKKKAVAEATGQMRALPPWKQEVRDEEGRRRFHGAFTGGFSAGYYNTAGSKEGWTPRSFTSSRKNRAEVKQQSIFNFLDDDEKAELEGRSLGTSLQFDTFGFTAAELARKQAEKEQQKRPSAIPGPVPDEIVLPAANSIGVKLLLKMGWRHGHSIRDAHSNSLYDVRREARKAFLAFSSDDAKTSSDQSEPVIRDHETTIEQPNDNIYSSQSTPVYVLHPKQDLHGLGYDPFKHAPEFREKKRQRVSGRDISMSESLFASRSGKVAPGFGIGALEELDVEDEDIYASGYGFEETYVEEVEEPSKMSRDHKQIMGKNEEGILPGFKVASKSDYQLERFDPPVIPNDFKPHHKFASPLEVENKFTEPPPLEVPPPEDNNMKVLIEGFATLVARCGKLFEDLSKEKNKSNPLFCFLTGGKGHDYYARKLWEEQQKRNDQKRQQMNLKPLPTEKKLTAESRGKILGEKPLERSLRDSDSSVTSADFLHLKINLSDTFTKPASLNEFLEAAKPFIDDPAKQERFELFLKEKYQGGLRSTDSGGSSTMSEAERARERLDFESAVEAIEKGGHSKGTNLSSSQQFLELSTATKLQFTSGGLEQVKSPQAEELITKKMYPKREEFQWRPSPILCKRFDIIDPYMGKPPPVPRPRSRMDTLIFTSDSVKTTKAEDTATTNRDALPLSQLEPEDKKFEITSMETVVDSNKENIERPVDLYKAIFSDDSDDEGESSSANQVENPEKKTEVANTTLNRLIAGDFLESLGKELGLEVPPDPVDSINKASTTASQKESLRASTGCVKHQPADVKSSSILDDVNKPVRTQEAAYGNISLLQIKTGSSSNGNNLDYANPQNDGTQVNSTIQSGGNSSKVDLGKMDPDDKRVKTCFRQDQGWKSSESSDDERSRRHSSRHRSQNSSSSSEDEQVQKHSRRHWSRSSTSGSDSSDGPRYRDHSRSKVEKKGSSRGKSSSTNRNKKHSRHRTHRNGDSPSSSSRHGTERRRHGEAKKEKRKSKDHGSSVSSKYGSHRKHRRDER
ncbi:PREDICTED: G patch domain-containing protein TGH [Nelumbo nucifera]|uniref:G patch domain-containing protein TGH n=2 Tax=Nelumbo nucifera TaxID=4432 RepID=A0A1U8AEE6_NELNU|nr:PREDICTED: G patch domain-containing protein TGH [Nelumbo nucifera]XP_010265341.1 PREDICTED: G patch domain-containing protein TGH [Nelumbo nucifera]DAD31634.1 TPA_asm: hypothetical protein HUJ06_010485 [Nelumbo nucifera]